MSIFGNIVSAIFGHHAAAAEAPTGSAGAAPSAPGGTSSAPGGASSGAPAGGASSAGAGTGAAGSSVGKPSPISPSEVNAKIEKIASSRKGEYNWKQSIVDLMKLLDLDSSLHAREELAKELGYTGKMDGSAEMNVWLHKKVMEELAASGGQVPDNLK